MINKLGFKEYCLKYLATLLKTKASSWAIKMQWKVHNLEARIDEMDKKMRSQVSKPLRKAEKVLRKGEKIVKKAEKSNDKLADYDEKKRDPIIAKAKKKGIR